ncbi:MAG: flavin reductase family protein [Defluviitaleaceae bacterium]|nr:flavin reductase family protein [Defluviitaleaceae bacterium]
MHPKAMFLYGTNKEGGNPNFALFTWFTLCWDGELCAMVCIGENKLTKDRILAEGKFSANLVSGAMLPLADYFGNKSGYDVDKMDIDVKTRRGKVLDVPILSDSPLIYELEVKHHMPLEEDSSVFICKIRNEIKPEGIGEGNLEDFVRQTPPALTIGYEYYTVQPTSKGKWGQWKNKES